MKKSILISLVLIFSTLAPPSAQAIFHVSKCEKVKKQLSVMENSLITALASVRGNHIEARALYSRISKAFILDQKSIATINKLTLNDPVPKIWKLAFNNPKCFTRTQNLQVAELKMKRIGDFVWKATEPFYRLGTKCKISFNESKGRWEGPESCSLGEKTYLVTHVEYKSIYDY